MRTALAIGTPRTSTDQVLRETTETAGRLTLMKRVYLGHGLSPMPVDESNQRCFCQFRHRAGGVCEDSMCRFEENVIV
jgi:hypothetical protein